MADITTRKRKNGGIAYFARIRLKKGGRVVYEENKTLETRKRAEQWIRERRVELDKPGELERAGLKTITLGDAIKRYMAEANHEIRRTKEQVLHAFLDREISGQQCADITATTLVALGQALLKEGRQPSTVGNMISHLAAIFAIARPAWDYPLDPQAMADARVVMSRMGVIAKSKHRDRRPTLEELDKLMTFFQSRSDRRPSATPMVRIIAFAIFSTRRQEEIITLRWEDFEPENNRVLIRDMKNPGQKEGNNIWCDLTPEAVQIMQAMPRIAPQVFPYTNDAISAGFTRACQQLGIEDLRFHDLRHEGISRLFEIKWGGGSIPHVAAVSGHMNWASLQRYTHIRQKDDKYANWKWLSAATTPAEIQKITANGGIPRSTRAMRNARQRVRLQQS